MKKLLSLALAVFAIVTSAPAFAATPEELFPSCTFVDTADRHTSGRFIWKPVASHYRQAVIIAPRRPFFPIAPRVDLFQEDGTKIETASLKSTGVCAGWHECLFAATFLTKRVGSRYENKYGKIIVRVRAGKGQNVTPSCKTYLVNHPKNRAEFHG
jgi:hypothetical protein